MQDYNFEAILQPDQNSDGKRDLDKVAREYGRNVVREKKLKQIAVVLGIVALLTLTGTLWAQSSTGTIEGTVLDSNQRAIAGAKVVVTQESTRRAVKVKTTKEGIYSVSGLDSGAYDITVSADTFGTEQVFGVELTAGSTVSQDFHLKPGAADSATVVVTASDDLVEHDTTSVNSSVSKDLLENIPLADQSSLGLVTLIPGVTGDPQFGNGVQSEIPGIYTNPVITGASISISGARPGLASQLVDGFDITQNSYPRVGITFTPGAIKGISVQMAGLPAEYGRTGGGIINQASQDGGVEFHGTLSYRHTDPFFGQAYRTGSNEPSDIHQSIYGGTIGGPVELPNFYYGKHPLKLNNTFFLFAYQPLRMRNVTFSRARLATPDELNGQFFNYPNGAVSLEMLNTTDLKTNGYAQAAADAASAITNCGQSACSIINQIFYQFPNAGGPGNLFPYGNQLGNTPTTSFKNFWQSAAYNKYRSPVPNDDLSAQVAQNPVAQFIKAHYPTPSNPGQYAVFDNALGTYDLNGNNAYAARGVVNQDDRWSLRVDHTFKNSDHLFGRYSVVPVNAVRYNFLGLNNPLDSIPTDEVTSRNFALNFVHLFSANIINESRASYLRANRYRIPPPVSLTQDWGASVGLVSATNGVGMPAMTFGDADSPNLPSVGGGGGFQDGGRSLDESYGYGNETTILFGRHQVKFGAEYRALQLNRKDVSNTYGGTYNFTNGETGSYGFAGSSMAAMDLGLIGTFTTGGSQPFYYRWKYMAGFVQDTWKARPNLTINYGLRYNLEFPRSEKFNNQGSFVSTATGTLNGLPVTGAMAHSGTFGLKKTMYPVNYWGFEPRLGLSYSPRPWAVVKASYALIHAPLTGVGNTIEPAFTPAAESLTNNTGGAATNGGILNASTNNAINGSALDFISNQPVPIARVGANLGNPLFSYSPTALLPEVDQNNAVPYVEVWNLGVDVSVGPKLVVSATYVGQRGLHLYSPLLATNLPSQTALYNAWQSGVNFAATMPNVYGLNNAEPVLDSYVPYQQFYSNAIYQAYNRHSSSYYNGMYLGARGQPIKGMTLTGGFSWSKSLDTNSTPTVDGTAIDAFGLTYPQDPYTLKGDYAVSSFDQPVRVTLGYNYLFPIGKGQKFFPRSHVINALFGGFSTAGYFSAQSGYPLSVGLGNNGYFCSTPPTATVACYYGATQLYNHLRPSYVPGQPIKNANWKHDKLGILTGKGILNQNAFQVPGAFNAPAYGNVPRELSAGRNPRSINWDGGIRKRIQVNRRVNVQLFVDVQNLANHPNFFLTTTPAGVFSGTAPSLSNFETNPANAFTQNTNFTVPNSFSATRTIYVGGSVAF